MAHCEELTNAEGIVIVHPIELIWKNCIFDLCGVKTVCRRTFNIIVTSTPEQRRAWLGEIDALVRRVFSSRG